MPHKTKCVNGWEWPFLLNTEERCYVLLAQTESDMRRWIDAVEAAIKMLREDEKRKVLQRLRQQEEFSKALHADTAEREDADQLKLFDQYINRLRSQEASSPEDHPIGGSAIVHYSSSGSPPSAEDMAKLLYSADDLESEAAASFGTHRKMMTLRDRPKAHTTKRAYKTLERGNSFVHVSRDADGEEEAVLLLDEEAEAASPSEEKHKDSDDPSIPSVPQKIDRLSNNNNDPRKYSNSGRKVSDGGGEEKKSIGRRKASHSDPIPVDNSRERPPAPVWRYGEVEEVLQEIMTKEKEIKRLHKSLRLAFISLDNSKEQEKGGDGGGGDGLEEKKENRKRTRLVRESFLSNSRKSVYEANGAKGKVHAAEQGEDNNKEGDEGKGIEKDVISDIEAKEKGKEKIVVEEEKAGGEEQSKFAKAEQISEVEEPSKQQHSSGMGAEEGGAATSQQEAEPEDITYVAKEPGWKAVSERSITKYHTNPADPHLEHQRKRKKTLASILRGERICNDLLKLVNQEIDHDVEFFVQRDSDPTRMELVFGHRAVLRVRSSFFDSLFTKAVKQKLAPEGPYIFSSTRAASFLKLLAYIYAGQLSLTDECTADVYRIAMLTRTKDLAVACRNYATKNSISLLDVKPICEADMPYHSFMRKEVRQTEN